MLLVDHDQAELRELDVVLNDRLRADDQVDLAGRDFCATSSRLRRPSAPVSNAQLARG